MCGRNPAHYAEYWKAVQELWLRLYMSNLVVIAAINVSPLTPKWPCSLEASGAEAGMSMPSEGKGALVTG